MIPHPPRGLVALLLLHEVVLVVLGLVGILSALFDAVLKNELQRSSGLHFGFGTLALLCGAALVLLVRRHPLRNRPALLGVVGISLVVLVGLTSGIPLVFFRLRVVPWSTWVVLLPTVVLAALSLLHARHLSRSHAVVHPALDLGPHAPTARSAAPDVAPSTTRE